MRATLPKLSAILLTYGPWGVFALALLDSMGVPLPGAHGLLLLGIGVDSVHSAVGARTSRR